MKNSFIKIITSTVITFSTLLNCISQTSPVIQGDTLICPNGQGLLTTQVYDYYFWSKRDPSALDPTPINGATSQTLTITSTDLPAYFSVVGISGSLGAISEEYFVDLYTFDSISVSLGGVYYLDNNNPGTLYVCTGDSILLGIMPPYDNEITWYKNDIAITNAHDTTFAVYNSGYYTVSSSPSDCTSYLQTLNIPLNIEVVNCNSSSLSELVTTPLSIYPNPVSNLLYIENDESEYQEITLIDQIGKEIYKETINQNTTKIDMTNWKSGLYVLKIECIDKVNTINIVVQH